MDADGIGSKLLSDAYIRLRAAVSSFVQEQDEKGARTPSPAKVQTALAALSHPKHPE